MTVFHVPFTDAVDGMIEWTDYDIRDGRVTQRFVEQHFERHARQRRDRVGVGYEDDDLYVLLQELDNHRNYRYRIGADGTFVSTFTAPEHHGTPRELQRHATITLQRFTPLLVRGNKAVEYRDWIEAFEKYDAAETVFNYLCDAPRPYTGGEALKDVIGREHGKPVLDRITENEPGLFERMGTAKIEEDKIPAVVNYVLKNPDKSVELPEALERQAQKLDLELCTKGRSMTDLYADDADERKTVQEHYYTVLDYVAEELDMEDLLEPYQWKYGDWSW